MNKKAVFALSVLICVLLPGSGGAFVPKSPHLLYLVIKKIKQPVGIEARQSKKIINYTDAARPYVEIEERLIYAYPGRFRTETVSGPVTGFSIEKESQFVKVIDGRIVSREKSLPDLYPDIIRYRDYQGLLVQLERAGVDTETVSYQRQNDNIFYVIGKSSEKDKPYSGLWIDKKNLFPAKYVVLRDNRVMEVYYDSWQRISKTWYPMQTSIFLDDQLHAMIDVKKIRLKSVRNDSLFDIDTVLQVYPDKTSREMTDGSPGQAGGPEKQITGFEKLFE